MKRLLTMGCVILCSIASAQVAVEEIKRNIFGNPFTAANQNYINMLAAMEQNNNVEFLFDDWTNMSVEGKDGNVMLIDSANYNINLDRVYFKSNGELYELKNGNVEKLILENRLFRNIIHRGGKFDAHLYEVLADGDLMLVKKHSVKTGTKSSNPMGVKDPNSTILERKSTLYYYDSKRGIVEKVPRNKAKLIQIFGRGNMRMVEYANKNNLSSKSEKDLIALFNFYNDHKEN